MFYLDFEENLEKLESEKKSLQKASEESGIDITSKILSIEKNLNKKAIIIYKNIQKGDIKDTLSDLKDTKKYISYKPQ